ncbi:gamma-glutamyl phosphate reductase [Moritella sp. PE36]|uniref:glutamate-5-semialdehyde dehydrogenase n=1 Tax=Moritella sp. PE36 TaxID=58051 RepID=UPI0001568A3D|nr:glutamate-5-semialdehyde dehydrogenase [Moritella sp. PE36]EDM67144.1 gamma-glutamyl phosphate reductase [Moritella sp. PE36]
MLQELGKKAKLASYELATLTTAQKNYALECIACELENSQAEILVENAKDIAAGKANGLTDALLDRLLLTEARLAAIIADVRGVIALPDPVGAESEGKVLENGLRLSKRRIPLGVMGVIYEARPNVTIDIAALSLKTGNAAILRGGKETVHSNLILVYLIQTALEKAQLPKDSIQVIADPNRELVTALLKMDKYVDMIIPRGGPGLHRLCQEQSTIPVITGGMGICHAFVDASANVEDALAIIENAKVQRPSACNALDTVLVHKDIAASFLPLLAERLATNAVELRAEPKAHIALSNVNAKNLHVATADCFDQEWLALVLGVKVVADVEEAIVHIREHSTEHSDAILTDNLTNATRFLNAVNSAAVYVNASTRFTDGSQFGLGAEVAVSTQKLHARGPMGLEELTTYKWIAIGDGLIRP